MADNIAPRRSCNEALVVSKLPPMQMEKLPKQLQNHIKSLYTEIECLMKDKSAFYNTPREGANTFLTHLHGPTGENKNEQPLPKNQGVRFLLDTIDTRHGKRDGTIRANMSPIGGALILHGSRPMILASQAPNIYVFKLGGER